MKKNKIISDSQLREAFREMPLESLPSGFTESLMSKIGKETARERRRGNLTVFVQIVAGTACMLLFPALAIYLCNQFIPGFSFSFSDISMRLDSNSITIGLAVLLLLVIDSLYDRYSANKRKRA